MRRAAVEVAALVALGGASLASAQDLHVIARSGGEIVHATAPSSWARLPGSCTGGPDAAGSGVAVRGTDDALWWVPLSGSPERVPSELRSAPGAAQRGDSLAVAAVGSDAAAWVIVRDRGKWGAWRSLGGVFPDGAAPDLSWDSSGRLAIIARGLDGAAWRGTLEGEAWSGWSSTGVTVTGDPTLVDEEPAFIGADSRAHLPGSEPSGEFPQGSGLDACLDASGSAAVVARGKDGAAWVNRRSGGAWTGWTSWGGSVDADPTCAFTAKGASAGAVASSKGGQPWADPQALAGALARWDQPLGPQAVAAAGPLESLIAGIRLDPAVLAAHVVRPKDAGLVTIEAPQLPSAEALRDARLFTLDEEAYRNGALSILSGSAGYYLELRRGGETILTLKKDWARPPAGSAPGLDWSATRRMHVASVSKLLSAIAIVRLLEQRGLGLDDRIDPFLPAAWTRGPGISSLTFRQLLTHRSGLATPSALPAGDSSWPALRMAIAAGSSGTGTYAYQNVNFGLCRILVPVLAGSLDAQRSFRPIAGLDAVSSEAAWDAVAVQAYASHVQQLVLDPAGVRSATIAPVRDDALAQVLPARGAGWESDDPRTLWYMTGTAGWHLTPDELLAIMGSLRRGGSIVPERTAQLMLDASVGVDPVTRTPAGLVATKAGYWETSAGCEQAIASFLPGDLELVVFVNSRIASGSGLGALPSAMDALFASSVRPR